MVYIEDSLYNIYCGTHMTDGVTDDIVWIKGTRMPWFKTRFGPEKRKRIHLIYVLYILYVNILYISYMHIIYFIYCIYM